MDLKYICKNDGYIIDRRANHAIEGEVNTFKTKGRMILTEVLPEDEKMKKNIVEYAFDSMKDNVLETFKEKYFLEDKELLNFYFEGKLENDDKKLIYVQFENQEIPVTQTNFNLDFEVELKITPKNFLKIQYDSLKSKI